MYRSRCLSLIVVLSLALGLAAQQAPPLVTATGLVDKVEKDSLTIRTRGPEGRFGKNLVLKLTGTSKISTLTAQQRAGKTVLVQRDTEAKDLAVKQTVAVIYTEGPAGAVLLSAVVQPAAGK